MTSLERQALQALLVDARQKLHALLTGGAAVEVMVDGYLTRFQRADADKLMAYIARLEALIDGQRIIGAIGVTF
jgi:hypothetical protein